jgi:hypothetical protein
MPSLDPAAHLDRLLADAGLGRELARHDARLDEIGEPRPQSSPRPFLCPSAYEPVFARICEVLHRSIEDLSQLWFSSARPRRFEELVPIPEHLAGVVHDRHGYAERNLFCRFDVHVDSRGAVRVLELNCADPSAIAWHDWMMRAVGSTQAWARFTRERDVRHRALVPLHWEVVRERHRIRNAPKSEADERVAFAIADASTVHFDFAAFARLYREIGVEAEVADPAAFALAGEHLELGGKEVGIVVRDTLDEIVPPHAPHALAETTRALHTALVESRPTFVNPTSSVLADQKALLELLSAPSFTERFPPADRSVLAEVLPWTRVLRPGRTLDEAGREIDLVSWVMDHGESLVLKPSEGYGGFGVTVGAAAGESRWKTAVGAALRSRVPHVVQRHAEAATFVVPPTSATHEPTHVPYNLSLWSFAGRFVGAIARASLGAVVNVHQGGLLLPVVFCD